MLYWVCREDGGIHSFFLAPWSQEAPTARLAPSWNGHTQERTPFDACVRGVGPHVNTRDTQGANRCCHQVRTRITPRCNQTRNKGFAFQVLNEARQRPRAGLELCNRPGESQQNRMCATLPSTILDPRSPGGQPHQPSPLSHLTRDALRRNTARCTTHRHEPEGSARRVSPVANGPQCDSAVEERPGVSGPDHDRTISPTSLCGPKISGPDNNRLGLNSDRSLCGSR